MASLNYEAQTAARLKAPEIYTEDGAPTKFRGRDENGKEYTVDLKVSNQSEALYGNVAVQAYELMKRRMITSSLEIDSITDDQWVKEDLYGQAGLELGEEYDRDRFWVSADRKFTDTSIGGHFVANPRPGFTPYADVPRPGVLSRNTFSPMMPATNQGMGSYYSKAIDDPARYIHLRFGKPEFNSLIGFFTGFYNSKEAIIANTGKPPGLLFYLGKVGGVVGLSFLLGGMLTFGLIAVSYLGPGIANIIKTNPNKFYYSRPCMPLYWTMVSNIVNQILTFQGVYPVYTNDAKLGEQVQFDQEMFNSLTTIMPEIFGEDGFVDVYATINRAERMNRRIHAQVEQLLGDNQYNSIEEIRQTVGNKKLDMQDIKKKGNSITQMAAMYLQTYSSVIKDKDTKALQSPVYSMQGTVSAKATAGQEHIGQFKDPKKSLESDNFDKGFFDNFKSLLMAEFSDGASFATLRVDHQGATSESFSNSTKPSDLAQKINGFSSNSRSAYYSFAGGNVGVPVLDEIIGATKEIATGALSVIKLDGLMSLGGAAFADIPDHWENSVANLPSMSYRMQLVSPYGHPVAQIQNIWIPLAMILAGTLPHSAGMRSYTQPFLVELYDPGFATTRTGIIESLTINRGTTHLGFNKNKQVLGIDVQFSIKDLSSIMYAPLSSGITYDPFETINATDSTWSDYLSVLSGATLSEQIYTGKKLKIRTKTWLRNIQQAGNADYWAGVLRNTTIGDLASLFAPDGGRGDR